MYAVVILRYALPPWPCPVSERLAMQLSKQNFRCIRINWTAHAENFYSANRSLTGHDPYVTASTEASPNLKCEIDNNNTIQYKCTD